MKHVLHIFCFTIITLCTYCSPTPCSEQEITEAFFKKITCAQLLLTQTYGQQNPFSELPLIIKSTYSKAQNLARITGPTSESNTLYLAALTHILNTYDSTLTTLIAAYENDTFREPILAQLLMLCSESIDLLSQSPETFDRSKVTNRQKKCKKYRFIPFISNSVLVTTGKWIAASAASVWLIYVLHKVYTYITLPNTELIEQTQNNQNEVFNTLKQVNNALTTNAPPLTAHTTTVHAPWWNINQKWQQWRARRKDATTFSKHIQNLRDTIPQSREAAAAITEWETAFTELLKAFPQKNTSH